jgi:hypothetical protein
MVKTLGIRGKDNATYVYPREETEEKLSDMTQGGGRLSIGGRREQAETTGCSSDLFWVVRFPKDPLTVLAEVGGSVWA